MAIYRKYTEWGRHINIGEGETYCPECNGRGCKFGNISIGSGYKSTVKIPCGFCQGYGKTDWIQIATNEPRISPPPEQYINYLKNNFAEFAALWITQKIDNDILKSLIISGRESQTLSYNLLKLYAKTAGVVVVTTTQRMPAASLNAVIHAGVEGILTGFTRPKEKLKNSIATSLDIQLIKSRQ